MTPRDDGEIDVVDEAHLRDVLALCGALGLERSPSSNCPRPAVLSPVMGRQPGTRDVRLAPADPQAGVPAPPADRSVDERKKAMAIGPVQLIVLGFKNPDFHGEIIAELERLKETDTVRVIDALAVYKDADGEVEAMHLSNLSTDEAIELGSKVGALIGLGFEGEPGLEAGAMAGAEAAADGVSVFSDDDAWDVLAEIPNDSAAALLLIEHHWAVPLRDAVFAPAGSASVTGSSARWTSSGSAGLGRGGRGVARSRDGVRVDLTRTISTELEEVPCSDHAGSPGGPRGGQLGVATAATEPR
jgi:uncharacterized membrane protein